MAEGIFVMRGAAFFLLFVLLPSWILAQVQGTVYNAETKQPLPEVLVSTATTTTTASNQQGFFSLPARLHAGTTILLHFSHPRYQDTTIQVDHFENLAVYLKPASIHLNEVEVIAATTTGTETAKITREELERITKPLGEADLIKAMQARPGVLQTGETQTGLFVRGGTSSQTGILLQGVPIFNSAHLLGINNALDIDAFESVTLTSGGFSASEGGWLSAYLQAEPRATTVSAPQLKIGAGVLSSGIGYQQSLPRYKTNIFAKARLSYFQLVAKAYDKFHRATEQDNPLPDYAFSDLNLQAYTELPKGNLSVAVFASQDRYDGNTDRFSLDSRWGNRLLSARWKHRVGQAWLEIRQGYSQYAFSMEYERQGQGIDIVDQKTYGYFSNLLLGLPLGNTGFIEAGTFLQATQADVKSSQHDKVERLLKKSTFTEELALGGFFTQAQLATGQVTYTAGARLYKHKQEALLAPRLKVSVSAGKWASSLYFDRTYQFHHQLNVLGINMPFDFFRFASEQLPVQQSDQVGLSVNKAIKQYKLSGGIYHRWLRGQLYYANAMELLTSSEESFEPHKGRAYGLEVELQAGWGQFSSTVGYTLAFSKTALEESGHTKWVYPVQDVRHQLNVTSQYALNKNWRLTGQWFLQTGSPYTFPVGIVPAQGMTPGSDIRLTPAFEEFNNVRTPIRHRLDVGAAYEKRHKRSTSTWSFGIYNLYNRANPYFFYFDVTRQEDGTGKIVAKQRSLLPFTPTVSYSCTLDL